MSVDQHGHHRRPACTGLGVETGESDLREVCCQCAKDTVESTGHTSGNGEPVHSLCTRVTGCSECFRGVGTLLRSWWCVEPVTAVTAGAPTRKPRRQCCTWPAAVELLNPDLLKIIINVVVRFYNWGLFLQLCVIAECGELKEGDDWGIFPKDGSGDSHPDFPEDADVDLKDVSNFRFWAFLVTRMVKNLPAM